VRRNKDAGNPTTSSVFELRVHCSLRVVANPPPDVRIAGVELLQRGVLAGCYTGVELLQRGVLAGCYIGVERATLPPPCAASLRV
jgi:hypothetical protein